MWKPDDRRRVAVALGYDVERMSAPTLLAKGFGEVARRILERARAQGIAIREDADLAEVLSRLDVSQVIPPELYRAVAEVLAYLYRANAGMA